MAYSLVRPQGATTPLPPGKTLVLMRQMEPQAGSWEIPFILDSDTVLFSLWVGSIVGTLNVTVYTSTGVPGEEVKIAEFPEISSQSSDLLLRKAAVAMSSVIVRIDATGPTQFDIRAKGLGTGDASVRIQGASVWSVGQISVGSTPQIIVPATMTDRSGLVIKNFSSAFLYVAESAAKANSAVGYPIGAGESLAFDLQAGQEIYGVAGSGTIDVRSAQAGEA